ARRSGQGPPQGPGHGHPPHGPSPVDLLRLAVASATPPARISRIMEKRVVDVWMQHPSKTFLAHPVFDSLRRWSHGGLSDVEIPLEATIRAMDEAGVRLGLICAWWGPQGPLISNDEVATFVRRHPDRLVGVASVDLYRPMDAVRELRRCVRQLGFRALRIVPWLWNLPPDDRRYYPLHAECVELDFPELKIVGGHIGYPWCAEMISLATKYPNVYIDTSAYKVRRYPRELVDYLRTHGRKKVL